MTLNTCIFKRIYDPINNDLVDSDDKNITYKNLEELRCALSLKNGNIISTHPHRWTTSSIIYFLKSALFKTLKFLAKILLRIPFAKKIMSKFYFLAKKF